MANGEITKKVLIAMARGRRAPARLGETASFRKGDAAVGSVVEVVLKAGGRMLIFSEEVLLFRAS